MLSFLSEVSERTRDGHKKWLCKCTCGNVDEYIATRVKHHRVNSCKKCSLLAMGEKNKSHGMKNTMTYSSWASMKDRCLNKKSKDYARYGEKGISVCAEWIDSFEQFYIDMGEKPKGTSIDRIDNNLGYFPKNCRWATHSEQQRNKSNSCLWLVNGNVYASLVDAAIEFGVAKQTIIKWVDGWTDKRRNKTWSPKNGCKRLPKY
jgi:hypothetical protein